MALLSLSFHNYMVVCMITTETSCREINVEKQFGEMLQIISDLGAVAVCCTPPSMVLMPGVRRFVSNTISPFVFLFK